MLYVFHGSDRAGSHKKARSLISSLIARRPDAAFEQINADNWSLDLLQSHLGGQGLFSQKYIIFLDRVSENELAIEIIPEYLEALKESSNIFIMLEGKVKADLSKGIEKHAEKVVISERSESFQKPGAEVFALADAVGSKNAYKSWSLYREVIDAGIETENIIGTLFWQLKCIAVASEATSAKETDLNPFVFSKSKRFSSNFSKHELGALTTDLVRMYHNGHRGILNMELELEKTLLTRLV